MLSKAFIILMFDVVTLSVVIPSAVLLSVLASNVL